ncbi:helix-turn-helix transcriptional regulator [Shinella sp. BE166]|uniref:helix-turn-helix transcriptional regulator n=1 Tax=unclassified Shinella TaxID=2643062 RepID=UPI003EBE6211
MTTAPRLIGRKEAAAYLGIAESTFSMWVASGKMPEPILGTRKWDKKAIDARLDEISGLAPIAPAAPAANTRGTFEHWDAQHKKRDKHRPIHRLDAREERILRFMIAHPDSTTVDLIPQAGEKTMEALAEVGVVRAGGRNHRGQREWFVADEGVAEIQRTDTWKNWKFD